MRRAGGGGRKKKKNEIDGREGRKYSTRVHLSTSFSCVGVIEGDGCEMEELKNANHKSLFPKLPLSCIRINATIPIFMAMILQPILVNTQANGARENTCFFAKGGLF